MDVKKRFENPVYWDLEFSLLGFGIWNFICFIFLKSRIWDVEAEVVAPQQKAARRVVAKAMAVAAQVVATA